MKDVCRLGSKYKRCLKDKDNKIQTETKKKIITETGDRGEGQMK